VGITRRDYYFSQLYYIEQYYEVVLKVVFGLVIWYNKFIMLKKRIGEGVTI
jgi:hypothetical protein